MVMGFFVRREDFFLYFNKMVAADTARNRLFQMEASAFGVVSSSR